MTLNEVPDASPPDAGTTERIRRCALLSVGRGVGFAGLAIGTTMVGLSYAPALALKTGAVLLALVAAVLWLKAVNAPRRRLNRTELWLLLDGETGLPAESAQRVVGGILRETHVRFARWAGLAAAVSGGLGLALDGLE